MSDSLIDCSFFVKEERRFLPRLTRRVFKGIPSALRLMDFLEGFEYFDFSDKAPAFHLRADGLTFNSGVTEALGYPPKCIFLFRPNMKQCALQGVDIDDVRGVDYYDPNNLPPGNKVKWGNKRLAKRVAEVGGLDLEKHEYIVHGYQMPQTDAMMFDLNTAEEV